MWCRSRRNIGKSAFASTFRGLNKTCPEDDFSIQYIESTTDYKVLSFMDGYSGYSQIKMCPKDNEMTTSRSWKEVFLLTTHAVRPKKCQGYIPPAITIIIKEIL